MQGEPCTIAWGGHAMFPLEAWGMSWLALKMCENRSSFGKNSLPALVFVLDCGDDDEDVEDDDDNDDDDDGEDDDDDGDDGDDDDDDDDADDDDDDNDRWY